MHTPLDTRPFLDFFAGKTAELTRLRKANTLLWMGLGVAVVAGLLAAVRVHQAQKQQRLPAHPTAQAGPQPFASRL